MQVGPRALEPRGRRGERLRPGPWLAPGPEPALSALPAGNLVGVIPSARPHACARSPCALFSRRVDLAVVVAGTSRSGHTRVGGSTWGWPVRLIQ